MHTVKPGPANQSYGIQVAKLAGIPESAIAFARDKLLALEKNSIGLDRKTNLNKPDTPNRATKQTDLFASDYSALNQAFSELNPDKLSPFEALKAIYKLKELT